ncbi:hypothetical protein [Streptomyces sp. NPDC018584]|uniref:hypothetical protein n=1 Tax=unclassified Streptomyces TaxID=2593676 RepID=UPI0037945C76
MRLYGRIAQGEGADAAQEPELEQLLAWGLVAYDEDHPEVLVALEPQEAVRRHAEGQLEQIAVQVQHMAALPKLSEDLGVHFARASWHSGRGAQFLAEPETVNARIQDVVASARTEILAAQPGGPRSRELADIAVKRDSAALRRGVRMRTLYRDTVRDDEVTQEWARTMSTLGGAYRTLVSPFRRCIIVDRRHAFISDYIVEGSPAHSAWHVSDRAVVGFMAAVFDDSWHRAQPWHGEPRTPGQEGVVGAGVRTTPLQREILRDLAGGRPQRTTAARLGMGLRTLTRHIEQLREMWGAESLPQLAALWMVSPDRLVDDSAPTASRAAGADREAGTAA